MNTYAEVCRMYFKEQLSITEIQDVLSAELKEYVHQYEDRAVKFTSTLDAAVEIILNEEEAHIQASHAG